MLISHAHCPLGICLWHNIAETAISVGQSSNMKDDVSFLISVFSLSVDQQVIDSLLFGLAWLVVD